MNVETPAVGRREIRRAAAAIRGLLHRTPTLSCRTLGPGVGLKAELLQRTGSFKPRGVLVRLARLTDEERARGVICWSAGNHAQAVAWAAAREGIDALVVMWRGASEAKIAATGGYGATLDLVADTPASAFERLAELRAHSGRTFIHAYDDPDVIAGQGTLGLEILEDARDVETVVVPCGGGGLVTGIAAACVPRGVRVVAVEPERSTALASALAAGDAVPVEPDSIADGLAAPFAGALPLRLARELGVDSVLVPDGAIEEAVRFLQQRAKLAPEPAGAAAVAALLTGAVDARRTVAVVSGGNVSARVAAAILARA